MGKFLRSSPLASKYEKRKSIFGRAVRICARLSWSMGVPRSRALNAAVALRGHSHQHLSGHCRAQAQCLLSTPAVKESAARGRAEGAGAAWTMYRPSAEANEMRKQLDICCPPKTPQVSCHKKNPKRVQGSPSLSFCILKGTLGPECKRRRFPLPRVVRPGLCTPILQNARAPATSPTRAMAPSTN